jgi:hypothetical protein
MTVLDNIRENSRIQRMRLGQEAPVMAALPSRPEVRAALVPLTEGEHQQTLEAAASLEVGDNPYGIEMRDRAMQVATVFHALREPDNLKKKVYESIEQMVSDEDVGLEFDDINKLNEEYLAMVDWSSPSLDGLDEEKLGELKKAFEMLDLSGLSGRAWHHLKMFFSTITVEQLQGRSPLPSFILNSMPRNDASESTPGAQES